MKKSNNTEVDDGTPGHALVLQRPTAVHELELFLQSELAKLGLAEQRQLFTSQRSGQQQMAVWTYIDITLERSSFSVQP